MSEHVFCRTCGQPLPPRQRGGVWLQFRKAEIFDFIDAHPGITAEGIAWHIYQDERKVKLVQTHICQINEMLAGTRIRIAGHSGTGIKGCYKIVRPKEKHR